MLIASLQPTPLSETLFFFFTGGAIMLMFCALVIFYDNALYRRYMSIMNVLFGSVPILIYLSPYGYRLGIFFELAFLTMSAALFFSPFLFRVKRYPMSMILETTAKLGIGAMLFIGFYGGGWLSMCRSGDSYALPLVMGLCLFILCCRSIFRDTEFKFIAPLIAITLLYEPLYVFVNYMIKTV